jgi:pimeloyl-ACP methyl ester carboxylesterase
VLRKFDPGAQATGEVRPPSVWLALPRQLRFWREPVRRLRARRRLAAAPRGEGRTVLVLPGLGVGDLSTHALRRFLRRRGFDCRGWGLGRHRPQVGDTLARMLPRLEELAAETGGRVALVGWSLGGIVARELARMRPDLVERVVTLGTPVVGGARGTALAAIARLYGWDLAEIDRAVAEVARTPIRVPVTAIFSRRDGIVGWQATLDRSTPGARHLEATSCHWALGLDPDVLEAVAAELAGEDSGATG